MVHMVTYNTIFIIQPLLVVLLYLLSTCNDVCSVFTANKVYMNVRANCKT